MAAGGVGYWPSDYWNLDYWHSDYWPSTTPVSVGQIPRGSRYRYGHRVHYITQVLLLGLVDILLLFLVR